MGDEILKHYLCRSKGQVVPQRANTILKLLNVVLHQTIMVLPHMTIVYVAGDKAMLVCE
jgi:hypothetical protein